METGSNDGLNSRHSAFDRYLILTLRWIFIGSILAAGLNGLIACRFVEESTEVAPVTTAEQQTPVPTPTRQTIRKKTAARLPRLEAVLVKNITARLNSWKASVEARDLEKHLQHYAEQIETYYLTSNVSQDFVRADRQRAFNQFDRMKLDVINVDVNLETSDQATVTFDKSWDFEKEAGFSNGLVQHEIKMRRIDKQWKIVSERDLHIYRLHNQ